MAKRTFSNREALEIGEQLGADWRIVNLDQFRMGLAVEFEHGSQNPDLDVTGDDTLTTGRIALAHLREIKDYYTRLAKMEAEANAEVEP
ncbi:MAG: DUF5661 family protein [Anaerolineaceae bacterium]